MLLFNVEHHKTKLDASTIRQQFDELDNIYAEKEVDDKETEMHATFLEERPPSKLEVSHEILEMIRHAESNIRIIQPYVQNIDELETLLVDAMKRNVKVEIITARNRDQPCYKTHLNSYLFQRLADKGAIVQEEPFKYLHMKAIEVDDGKVMTLGSFN